MAVDNEDSFEDLHSLQRSTILRVYNYYRILISFLFLYLFSDENFREFVGSANPELFQDTILVYLSANILIGLALPLFISDEFISKTAPSFIILTLDIIALTLLMSASGGVASGLGNFLIFTAAFGGGLIYGRISTVLPAIAFILTIVVVDDHNHFACRDRLDRVFNGVELLTHGGQPRSMKCG